MSISISKKGFNKVGKLTKVGKNVKSWRERVFILSKEDKVMYYFASETDYDIFLNCEVKNYLGEIPLQDATLSIANHLYDQKQCIEIETSAGRRFYMYAPTKQDRISWITELVSAEVNVKIPAAYGFLLKRGKWNKAFKRRFVRTETEGEQRVLAYYETSVQCKGKVILDQASIVSGDDCEFTVTSSKPDRALILKASSKQEKLKWIQALTSLSQGGRAERILDNPAAAESDEFRIRGFEKEEEELEGKEEKDQTKEREDKENRESEKEKEKEKEKRELEEKEKGQAKQEKGNENNATGS